MFPLKPMRSLVTCVFTIAKSPERATLGAPSLRHETALGRGRLANSGYIERDEEKHGPAKAGLETGFPLVIPL